MLKGEKSYIDILYVDGVLGVVGLVLLWVFLKDGKCTVRQQVKIEQR